MVEQFDKKYLDDLEKSFIKRALMATGYGQNQLVLGNVTRDFNPIYRKPY